MLLAMMKSLNLAKLLFALAVLFGVAGCAVDGPGNRDSAGSAVPEQVVQIPGDGLTLSGASSNFATEDLTYLFASMGIATGIDFERLMALRQQLASWLAGERLHGSIAQAGLPRTMRSPSPAPAPQESR